MPIQKPFRSRQDEMTITQALDAVRKDFWSRVLRRGSAECWPWLAGQSSTGYGWIYICGGRRNPVRTYAHRAALYYSTGKWKSVARHTCDNPICCNPRHLRWGTKRDNAQDALRRGRAYIGESNSNAKLTNRQVLQIRRLRSSGLTYKEISGATGVTTSRIAFVVTRQGWTHV